MKTALVENNPTLVRDLETGSIVNMDEQGYRSHKKQKALARQKLEAEQAREERINKIEKDVSELKTGISKILEILSNGNN